MESCTLPEKNKQQRHQKIVKRQKKTSNETKNGKETKKIVAKKIVKRQKNSTETNKTNQPRREALSYTAHILGVFFEFFLCEEGLSYLARKPFHTRLTIQEFDRLLDAIFTYVYCVCVCVYVCMYIYIYITKIIQTDKNYMVEHTHTLAKCLGLGLSCSVIVAC